MGRGERQTGSYTCVLTMSAASLRLGPGVHRAALVVLVALVVSTPWPYGAADPSAVRAIALVALATALAVLGAQLFRGRAHSAPFPAWPLAALFALAIVQITPLPRAILFLVAPGPARIWYPEVPAAAAVVGLGAHPASIEPDATRRVLAFTTGVLALALLSVPALRARRTALASALVVSGGALVVAIYGVVARTLFGPLLFGRVAVPTIAPFGSFVSKNHFAGYVEMAALLCAGLAWGLADEARRSPAALSWVGSPRAGRVVVAAGAAIAMGLAVLLSQSRGGALSLIVGALALVSLRLFVRRRTGVVRTGVARTGAVRARRVGLAALVVAGLGLGAVAVLPPEARSRLATLTGMSHDNSGQFRLGVWGDTVRLWATSPLVGQGLGAFADALPPVKTGLGYVTIEHAESDGLELLAEGGLVGLLVAIAALAGAARVVGSGLSRQTDRLKRGLGLGAFAGAAALLFHSAFDFNLRIPSNALLFAFLCALALAVAEGPATATSRGATGALAVAVAVALAFAVATPAASVQNLPDEAQAFAVKGGRPVTPLRVAQATDALVAHLQRRPADAESWLFLAWLRAAAGGGGEAKALAAYAAGLDPERAAIQSEAVRIQAGPQ
jgi:O-antigen ligase